MVGQNVVLNCAVQFKDGQEKPFVVNWLKYPHKLPIYIWYAGYPPHVAQGYEARVSRLGQASLNLSQVRESDQGLYECKIYYLDRKPEDKTNGTWIFLDVQGKFSFEYIYIYMHNRTYTHTSFVHTLVHTYTRNQSRASLNARTPTLSLA